MTRPPHIRFEGSAGVVRSAKHQVGRCNGRAAEIMLQCHERLQGRETIRQPIGVGDASGASLRRGGQRTKRETSVVLSPVQENPVARQPEVVQGQDHGNPPLLRPGRQEHPQVRGMLKMHQINRMLIQPAVECLLDGWHVQGIRQRRRCGMGNPPDADACVRLLAHGNGRAGFSAREDQDLMPHGLQALRQGECVSPGSTD
ncbi:hypothetical protein D3C87_1536840 [compost metagenome]